MNKYNLCLIITAGVAGLIAGTLGSAQETNTYHTNRVFHKVTFTIPGTPSAFDVCTMAAQLTSIVGPTNVITNSFHATEYQGIVVGYGSDVQAWAAVMAGYSSNSIVHDNSFYDNAGWVKGLHQTWDGKWGGYIWAMQNTVNFKTSSNNVWVSTNGVTNAISKVLVGTIGDYLPMTDQSDTGPGIAEGLTNWPTGDSSNDMRYTADFTAYYDIGLPALWIQPMLTNVCINSGNVTFTLITNSYVPNGVTWSITPDGLSNGATWTGYPTNIVINVGGAATSYVVRATANDNTNVFGFAVLNVFELDLIGDNDDDGDVDEDDEVVKNTLPLIVALNQDTRDLTVRKVGIATGSLKIEKTGTGKITLKKSNGTTVLGENDSESTDILSDVTSSDLVLTLAGNNVGDVGLELRFTSGSSTCSDSLIVKVVRSDIVQRSGNTYLAALIGEARTHSGIDWQQYVTDLYDSGIERTSLATYESLADGGPDKKRLRLKKNLYMAHRVWAKVYDNMDAQAYSLPTSAHPWNLFTTSTNYTTANCNELVTEQFRRAIGEVHDELTDPSQQTAFESTWYSGGFVNPLATGKHLVLFPGKSPMAGLTISVMETALNYRSKCVGATTQFQNNYEGEILIFWYNTFTVTRYTAGASCSICATNYPTAPWYVVPFLELWDEAHHSTITPDSFVGSSFFEEITY